MEKQNSIRVIRVFLASPSDLGDERRAARTAVDEINRTVARPAGFHVDLIGWEDTLSEAGRPQAIINDELASCQMFIGMLWGRWGTPPDAEGRFTSGFEEEFTLASESHSRSGTPHMTLFFKDVDKSQLGDPGPELSRVLDFKQRVVDERRILFDTFASTSEFEARVRLGIADYIHRLDDDRRRERPGAAASAGSIDQPDANEPSNAEEPSGGGGEAAFLNEAGSVLAADGAGLSPTQVARLRLIALAAGHAGNDEVAIGAHDSNLLYRATAATVLSARETSALADAGIEASGEENKPLWTWLAACLARFPAWLTYTTAAGPDRRRAGAIRVMAILGTPIVYDDPFGAEELGQAWFGGNASSTVRNAALAYVAEHGDASWAELAEREFERNDYSTRKAALEAVIMARAREGSRSAALYAVKTSFDALGEVATKVALEGMAELDDGELSTALESRYGPVRSRAVELLADRRALDEPTLRRLLDDPFVGVRASALAAFERLVRPMTPTEAEKVLKKPQQPSGGLLASGFDAAADAAHRDWKRRTLSRSSLADLHEKGPHALATEDRLAAMTFGHAKAIAPELRAEVDDRFRSYWSRYLETLRGQVGTADSAADIVAMFDAHQELRRRNLIRIALDALERLRDPQDLARIRRVLDEGACETTSADVGYLARVGGWEDIRRIARSGSSSTGAASLLIGAGARPAGSVQAILKLAGDRIQELVGLELPHDLLGGLLASVSDARFRSLGREQVDRLLHHVAADVRKATALKLLTAAPISEVRSVLDSYLDGDGTTYYNVVFWLDLAKAQKREAYRPIALRELARMRG